MRRTVLVLVVAAVPLAAQSTVDVKQRAARAAALPGSTTALRSAGVTDRALTQVVQQLQRDLFPVSDIADVLELEREALVDGGRPETFGAFVGQLRAQGLRGQSLATAIHAERARRGGGHRVGVGGPPAGISGAQGGQRGGPPAGVGAGARGGQGGGPPTGRGGRGG